MAEKYKYLESGHWIASQNGTRPALGVSGNAGLGCTLIVFLLGVLVGIALFIVLF